MSKNEERKKLKDYDKNFIRWIITLRKRFKVPLFLLVFAMLIWGMSFWLSALLDNIN